MEVGVFYFVSSGISTVFQWTIAAFAITFTICSICIPQVVTPCRNVHCMYACYLYPQFVTPCRNVNVMHVLNETGEGGKRVGRSQTIRVNFNVCTSMRVFFRRPPHQWIRKLKSQMGSFIFKEIWDNFFHHLVYPTATHDITNFVGSRWSWEFGLSKFVIGFVCALKHGCRIYFKHERNIPKWNHLYHVNVLHRWNWNII